MQFQIYDCEFHLSSSTNFTLHVSQQRYFLKGIYYTPTLQLCVFLENSFNVTTKLNLTIDEKTAKKIKVYAARKNTSVSKIAEEYFKKLTENQKKKNEFRSFVKKYAGSIKRKEPIDIKKERDEYLKEKYGL